MSENSAKEKVNIIGVYKVDEAEDVYLIELMIDDKPSNIDVDGIQQTDPDLDEDDWQAAFDEYYLNADGTEVIGDYCDLPEDDTDKTRLCFFMYLFDFNKPLRTQYGIINLPKSKKMPKRLGEIIEFDDPE
ncbi:MAG: hypothetical protein IKQ18_05440 [Clostridia bacterium]|jgi:hypothetical protein|nr:hypothetical protein [Clostridia bacterium]